MNKETFDKARFIQYDIAELTQDLTGINSIVEEREYNFKLMPEYKKGQYPEVDSIVGKFIEDMRTFIEQKTAALQEEFNKL